MNQIAIVIAGAQGRMGKTILECLENQAVADHLILGGGLEQKNHRDIGKPMTRENTSPLLCQNLAQAFEPVKAKFRQFALIDFTTPQATLSHLQECQRLQLPMVIGTTGFADSEKKEILSGAKKIPIVLSPNFSVGVNLVTKAVEEMAARIPNHYDLEVVEAHHRLKKDAPSGTAWRLAQALADGRKINLREVVCLHREGQTGERPEGQIGIQTVRGGDIVGDHTVMFAGPGERIEIIHRAHNRSNFAAGALRAALWLWQNNKPRAPGLYDMFDVLHLRNP